MDDATNSLPELASLRFWGQRGYPEVAMRKAIAAGELRASRPTRRTIRVLRDDLLEWLAGHAVEPDAERQAGQPDAPEARGGRW